MKVELPDFAIELSKDTNWFFMCKFGNLAGLAYRVKNTEVRYNFMWRLTFPFLQPHKLVDSEVFNIKFYNPALLETPGDKMRYYRYKKALRIKDVARALGVCDETYASYERGTRAYFLPEHITKIVEILGLTVDYLLDDYNRFLFEGQAVQLKAFRTQNKWTQSQFASKMGVELHSVKDWEQDKVRMTKLKWEQFIELCSVGVKK